MRPPKLYHHAHHTWHGISAFILKILKSLLLLGILLFINSFTEYFLGGEVISYLAIILITVLFSMYAVISHFRKANFFYLIGWIVGILLIHEANLEFIHLDALHLSIYIGIPTIMFVVRFIMYLYSDREEF
jgi:hypothetical protein